MVKQDLESVSLCFFSFGRGRGVDGVLLATWHDEKIHSDKPCGKGENQYDRHTESECGPGTAIQAHCSDHVPAELMALTASWEE